MIKEARSLPDNYEYALKMLQKTEKRLCKDTNWQRTYSEQVEDMIGRNVARQLHATEINDYNGPIHYITHHAVVKPESKNTPVRIVFNSSANYKGHVLNNYWAKGPDAFLNSLLGILLRFRENYVAYTGDIKKMYNSVKITEFDQHCHRFLWRDMDMTVSPNIYVITAVNIGDRPSGTIATLALHKTAELEEKNYPIEAKIIKESS